MLYLIFPQRITVGQFFSLFIYSFFIFGPLQELGNVINTYRETEVSLQNFQEILDTAPRPEAGKSGAARRADDPEVRESKLSASKFFSAGAR